MKKFILFFILLFSIASAYSQTSGGPDAFGYTWRNSNDTAGPTYSWIDITTLPGAVQVSGLTDDNTAGFFPVGFQFPYYWYTVSQFKVGSNGYLIFNNGAIASPFPAIPSSSLPQDFIGPFMSDLQFSGSGNTAQCWYWSNQTDTLILSYINVPFWQNSNPPYTGANTFQVILSKVDSSITFQYALQSGISSATTNFISIGIENNSGTIGLQQALDFYPPQSYAIKFYYPQSGSFVVNDASVASVNNPESGGLFLSKDGSPYTMSATIANTGNQNLDSIAVDMQIVDELGTIQVQESLLSAAIPPGQTQNLTATTAFNPTTAGTYKFITTTTLAGDATPTNNSKTQELVVVDTTQNFITLGNTADIPNNAISWTGGDAGAGVEFVPPFYPCYIRSMSYFIVDDPNFVGFHSLLYDNNGPNHGPGNLLDSVFIDPSQEIVSDWNIVNLQTPIEIDSGSVYVGWMMNGESILLGTDSGAVACNRTYEILGAWAIYRSRENTDLMIRLVITGSPTTGIDKAISDDFVGEFYPSPSNDKVFINTDFINDNGNLNFAFYDVNGKLVESKTVNHTYGQHQTYSFDVSKRSAGIYVCKITSGTKEYNRKLIVKQ